MDLQKVGIKFFAEENNQVKLADFIPIFHRWIQESLLDDVMIDVADYSHVYSGPGILLISHEGNYAIDETKNKRGLTYYKKRGENVSLDNLLVSVGVKALRACQLLEQEETIKGRINFSSDQLQIYANDRLIAPNSEDTYKEIEPKVLTFLEKLYPGQEYKIKRENDAKERLCITVNVADNIDITTLLDRLAA